MLALLPTGAVTQNPPSTVFHQTRPEYSWKGLGPGIGCRRHVGKSIEGHGLRLTGVDTSIAGKPKMKFVGCACSVGLLIRWRWFLTTISIIPTMLGLIHRSSNCSEVLQGGIGVIHLMFRSVVNGSKEFLFGCLS